MYRRRLCEYEFGVGDAPGLHGPHTHDRALHRQHLFAAGELRFALMIPAVLALTGPALADELMAGRFVMADVRAAASVTEPPASSHSARLHALHAAVTTQGSSATPTELLAGSAKASVPAAQLDRRTPDPIATGAEVAAAQSLTGEAVSVDDADRTPARSAAFYWLMLLISTLTLGSFAFASSRVSGGVATAMSSWRGLVDWAGERARRLWSSRGDDADLAPAAALTAWRADLHDGPAQHLAYALMHLDEIEPVDAPEGDPRWISYRKVEQALRSALEETREIASGTSLQAIRRLDPATVIADAVSSHESRTHTSVQSHITGLPPALAPSVKVCLYRFAQEGLNNAYRHARGKGQKLTVRLSGNEILAEVADEGPGAVDAETKSDRLGLSGLRQRAEAAGGRLEVVSMPGKGTKLVLRLPASKRVGSE